MVGGGYADAHRRGKLGEEIVNTISRTGPGLVQRLLPAYAAERGKRRKFFFRPVTHDNTEANTSEHFVAKHPAIEKVAATPLKENERHDQTGT